MDDIPSKLCPRCKELKPLNEPHWRHRSDKRHLWRPYCFKCDRPPIKGPRPSLIVEGQKLCNECKKWFPANTDTFGVNKVNGVMYLRSKCKPCQTITHARFVAKNPSKIKAIAKRAYNKNREKIIQKEIERDKKERADPVLGPIRREKHNLMAAKRRKNPDYLEYMRERDRKYAQTPAGSARYTRRRARKIGAEGSYTKADLILIAEKQGFQCYWCLCDISNKPTADHYIPLSRGGSNYPENIVAACGPCNSTKHNKLPEEFIEFLKLRNARACRQ